MEETTEMNDIYTTELLGLGVTLTEKDRLFFREYREPMDGRT